MKNWMNGIVYLLNFTLSLIHCSFIADGYNHRLANEKMSLRSRRQEEEQNVGTVLFDKVDITKDCWSNDELTLLNSRIIFNDILPQADLIDVSNDKYIDMFLNYVDICLEMVQKLATGKTKHLIMKALADTMGGYLRVYILPLTKSSYYAGNIKYHKAKRIFDLYENFKLFLRTNGVGWFKPIASSYNFKISPLFIPHYNHSRRTRASCSNLILYPANDNNANEDLVPIPFLDDDEKPSSIALPYEKMRLRSLFSDKSAFILMKYYIDGVNCISLSSADTNQLNKFKKQLNEWLYRVVKPLLNNDKWYPAFGGVLRVIASLEVANIESSSQPHDERYHTPSEYYTESPLLGSPLNNPINSQFSFIEIVVITISIMILVYLLIGLCVNLCIMYSRERRKIEAFKQTPIFEFYKSPRTIQCTQSTASLRNQMKSSSCRCNNENDDEEKYLNELTYSSTCAISPIRSKWSKSLSAPVIPCTSSLKQSYYSSDETSVSSSSLARESSS